MPEDLTKSDRFDRAMQELTRKVNDWAELLNDPYKPPELKLGLPPGVTAAAWNVGITWEVLTNQEC